MLDMSSPRLLVFFLMTPPPPTSTLFPYTTLFRSARGGVEPNGDVYRIMRVAYPVAFLTMIGEGWLRGVRSEEHTSELQSLRHLVCRLLLEKKKKQVARFRTRSITLAFESH